MNVKDFKKSFDIIMEDVVGHHDVEAFVMDAMDTMPEIFKALDEANRLLKGWIEHADGEACDCPVCSDTRTWIEQYEIE